MGAWFLLVCLVSLLVAHLAGIATKVLQDIQWHELELYARRKEKDRFDRIHDNYVEVFSGTETLLYLAIASYVFFGLAWITSWLTTSHLLDSGNVAAPALLFVAGIVLFLAAVVWFPAAIAEFVGTAFIYHTWSAWQMVTRLLSPFSWGSDLARIMVKRLLGVTEDESDEEALEEEIRTMVVEGQYDGLLDSDTRDMIEGVIELDDANVADIMTPRDEMDVMSVELTWNEVLDYVTEVGRTRIPVYNDSRNEFIGLLYVKDLFAEMNKPESERRQLRDVLRQTWTVPRTLHLDELLQLFRQTRNHLALVSDEYNGIAGLVTIEDVLEEIVGEIVDESDKEDLGEIRVINQHEAEVVGRAHVEDINQTLGTDLPEDDEFDTISGFLMHKLGRVPMQGDYVYWHDLRVTVLDASRRRAELVRIATATDAPSDLLTGQQ